MNIKWKQNEPPQVEFEKLKPGDAFYSSSCDIYMKIEDPINHMACGANLRTGRLTTFGNKTKVTMLNAEVVFTE